MNILEYYRKFDKCPRCKSNIIDDKGRYEYRCYTECFSIENIYNQFVVKIYSKIYFINYSPYITYFHKKGISTGYEYLFHKRIDLNTLKLFIVSNEELDNRFEKITLLM